MSTLLLQGGVAWNWMGRAMLRLISIAVSLLGLLLLTFVIGRMLPVDPVAAIVGDHASQETYERVFRELGLDRPLYEQFVTYISGVLQFDLGNALYTGNRVIDDIARVLPATIELATPAVIIGMLVGVPIGVMAAAHRGGRSDATIRIVSLLGVSIPAFWLGMLALKAFYYDLAWVPGPGRVSIFYSGMTPSVTGMLTVDAALAGQWEVMWSALHHMILPVLILSFVSVAYISRMTRSFMIEQLSQEYIVAARLKGVTEREVIWKHAFLNIRAQLFTVFALSYAFLLEGSILTETIFAWPGIGRYMTTSLLAGDINAVLGATLVIGLLFMLLNQLSDAATHFFDVRSK